MKRNPIEEGWQRFLDRLKKLWGKRTGPEPAAPQGPSGATR
jgi:hypothetical protein